MTTHDEHAAQRRPVAPPVSAELRGIWYNGGIQSSAPGGIGVPRGLAPKGLVSMRLNDTRTLPKSEYCTITVNAGGKLANTSPTVDVLVDARFANDLAKHRWRAHGDTEVRAITTRIDGGDVGIAHVVFRLAYGYDRSRVSCANKNICDARISNLVGMGKFVAIKDERDEAELHLPGSVKSHHVALDVSAQRIAQAEAELAKRKKDAALLRRSNSRAQRKRSGHGISESRRLAILERDGGICFYCEYEADQVDHIIPYAHGGTDDDNNLVACCQICNLIASDKVFDTLEQKRDFIRDQYGPWMKKRYRRLLRKLSICADCRKVYNPQEKGATVVLCKACYRADCLGLNGELA